MNSYRSKNWQALGRLKSGVMNRTEQAYVSTYLEPAKQRGEVLWWKFEGITLKLADNCRFTADFAVLMSNLEIELHDVKGSKFIFTDDAKVKVKTAAEYFPFKIKVAIPKPKREGGGWEFEEF